MVRFLYSLDLVKFLYLAGWGLLALWVVVILVTLGLGPEVVGLFDGFSWVLVTWSLGCGLVHLVWFEVWVLDKKWGLKFGTKTILLLGPCVPSFGLGVGFLGF